MVIVYITYKISHMLWGRISSISFSYHILFACGYPVVTVSSVEKTIPPLNRLGALIEIQLTRGVVAYLWTLNSSPWIYASGLITEALYYVLKSRRTLFFPFFQDCFGYSELSAFSHEFQDELANFCNGSSCDFDRDCIESTDKPGEIFNLGCLPIYLFL